MKLKNRIRLWGLVLKSVFVSVFVAPDEKTTRKIAACTFPRKKKA
jgi:hypothetical protein